MGAAYSINIKKHIRILEKTLLMIEEMKVLLQYLNIPVNEIINTLCRKDYLKELEYLEKCRLYLCDGTDFPAAWKNSLHGTSHLYKSAEIERLLHLGQNLGVSNTDNQLKMLELQTNYFEEFLLQAKNKCKKYGNIAVTLGALTGCIIFIVII